jgi:hypothetical protein
MSIILIPMKGTMSGKQDVKSDLVRGFLSLRTLDQGNHPIEKGLAGVASNLHLDAIG